MTERPYEFLRTPEGPVLRVRARGIGVLTTPILNRGTAFTPEQRRALGLVGLLPEGTSTIAGQVRRVYAQRPRRRAAERDQAAIDRWVKERWPRIKQTPNGAEPVWSSSTSPRSA
jgi:hypothetical protein